MALGLVRVRNTQRTIARARLAQFLSWTMFHACRRSGLLGRPITLLTLEQAAGATERYMAELADGRAFGYFGIASSFDLGVVPVRAMHFPTRPGAVAIANMPQIVAWILDGGARGHGWVAPDEITIDDLAR